MKTLHPSCSGTRGFLGLLLVLLCGATWAQEARVRSSLTTNDTFWVGQKITVVVELLAPGYFAGAPSFALPDPQGVLLLPPAGHPLVSSETIGDTHYSVQRHELAAFPMHAGEQTIPAIPVRFSFKRAPLDTNEVAATVTTTPMPYEVKQPPGTENLGQVISARDLKVEETWQPEPGKTNLLAGSAFTRTITFSAPDMPGMVFPPFPAGEIDGLGIYTQRQLRDQSDRGTMRGERQDIVTYVCQRPGQFTIPAARFIWFDLETKQLRTNDLPAHTLTVIENPKLTSVSGVTPHGAGPASRPISWTWLAVVVIAVVLTGVAGRSRRCRWVVARWFDLLRPIRLQPLNPKPDAAGRATPGRR